MSLKVRYFDTSRNPKETLMETQVIQKNEVSKSKSVTGKTLTLRGIPNWVHKRIKNYQNRISAEKNKKFTIKEAYVEFLKDSCK
jgi:hypothetical protein